MASYSKASQSVCMIGAGPSGLSCLYHFSRLQKQGKKIPEVVCYDKQGDIGGLWNFTWRSGVDQYGEPCHESMYRNLWCNMPKECLEFHDYSFHEHFGRALPSYPPREVILDYIKGRFEKENVKRFIKFKTVVRRVEFDKESNQFLVIAKDLVADTEIQKKFSHVIVATGHFSYPNVPDFDGIETFPGPVFHATDFKDANGYAGQRILIIGAGRSADDLALQLKKYGAQSVICSYRDKPMGFMWPRGIEERPLLRTVRGKTVYFRPEKDGGRDTKAEVDTIIFCTGYIYNFPFLPDNLRLRTDLSMYPVDLYKGILWIKDGNNRLFYIGMQNQFYTFTMFDVQAEWTCGVIIGERKLPKKSEMQADIDKWLIKNAELTGTLEKISFQTDYVEDLRKQTKRHESLDMSSMLTQWVQDRENGITTYRDNVFTSVVSGYTATKPRKTWMKNFDDTLEEVLDRTEQA